jgi:predicted small integral membrane protein
MLAIRISKTLLVASIALFATLVAFGNITDYGTNFAFVRHVLMMDTIFPDATIGYRAIHAPWLHHAAYVVIIAVEAVTAILCWVGAAAMWRRRDASARAFNRAKKRAVIGLTLGFLLWQVGFMTIGGEWFGMWMSQTWNGIESAFRFFITILAVLIYVSLPDGELEPDER